MRKWLPIVALIVLFVPHPSSAQAPAGQAAPAPLKLFAAAGDVTAMIERARKERKPDQANFIQPIVGLRPFSANLEYRAAGVNAPASSHDKDAEMFYGVEGSGTLVTGGKIVNGRRSPAESEVTKILNGPSCSGTTTGADVVKKVVKTGDIIIIPAGVPHGWSDIPEHVDYLSFRPSARVLEAGYVNPALKK